MTLLLFIGDSKELGICDRSREDEAFLSYEEWERIKEASFAVIRKVGRGNPEYFIKDNCTLDIRKGGSQRSLFLCSQECQFLNGAGF